MFSLFKTLAERSLVSQSRIPPSSTTASHAVRFERGDISEIFENRIDPNTRAANWAPCVIQGDDGQLKIQEVTPTGASQLCLQGPPEGTETLRQLLSGLGIQIEEQIESVLQAVTARCCRQSCGPFDLDGRFSRALEEEAENRLHRAELLLKLHPLSREQLWQLVEKDCEHCLNCLKLIEQEQPSHTHRLLELSAIALGSTTRGWSELEQGRGWQVAEELSDASRALVCLAEAYGAEAARPYVKYYSQVNNAFMARCSDNQAAGIDYEVGNVRKGPDLDRFTSGFDYKTDGKSSRIICGNDGNRYIQQRTLLGIEQFLVDGCWSFAALPDRRALPEDLVAEHLERPAQACDSVESDPIEPRSGTILNALNFHTRRMMLFGNHLDECGRQFNRENELLERFYRLIGSEKFDDGTKELRPLLNTIITHCRNSAADLLGATDYLGVERVFENSARKLLSLSQNGNFCSVYDAMEKLNLYRTIIWEEMPFDSVPRLRSRLKEDLAAAVEAEEYEKAAQLNRQLKSLPQPQ